MAISVPYDTPVNATNLILISPIISYYNATDKHYTCSLCTHAIKFKD
ncbi:unnamed protein product [Trifolium pratense]|uniref:Uncharacterized protein n=1 Tax=Trifolium pratense TaxID=57577 RepID=A0ACB0IXC0_TRIPR|nr:unnamed protein product [Trifolium pratense]